jgi:hypothetical protein
VIGDGIKRSVEHADDGSLGIGAGMADDLRHRNVIGIAERGRERDLHRPSVRCEPLDQIGTLADRGLPAHDECDILGIEDRERREALGIGLGHAHQVVGRHVRRADTDDMRIAGAALHVDPGLAAAVAADIDDLDRNLDQPVCLDGLGQRSRRTVEAAARRRAGDDLELACRLPAHLRCSAFGCGMVSASWQA